MASERPAGSVLRGMGRLMLLRADGLAEFGNTPQAFLNSLAPLAAFAIVGAVVGIASGAVLDTLLQCLSTVVILLTPPVASHFLASYWQRSERWCRFATAFNWSNWLVLLAFAVLILLGTGLLISVGMPPRGALVVTLLAWLAYGLCLHWLIARRGLDLGIWQTLILMIVVEFGTVILAVGPLVAQAAFA